MINALRGLTSNDVGGAKIGTTENIQEPQCFHHPQNKLIEFWDLPGIGSQGLTNTNYVQKTHFASYHMFIVTSSTRFTSEDLWLTNTVKRMSKKLLFVRTKITNDLPTKERKYPENENESSVLDKIRLDCNKHLNGEDVFLVDSYEVDRFDFPLLMSIFTDDENAYLKSAMGDWYSSKQNHLEALRERALKTQIEGCILLPCLHCLRLIFCCFTCSCIDSPYKVYAAECIKMFGLDTDSVHKTNHFEAITITEAVSQKEKEFTSEERLRLARNDAHSEQTWKSQFLSSLEAIVLSFLPILVNPDCRG